MSFKLKENEVYLIATDLDGTFLTGEISSIHIDNYEAIKLAQKLNHKIVITTGRSWWWTKKIYKQIHSIDASIQFSGNQIVHPNDSNFPRISHSMDKEFIIESFIDLNLAELSEFIVVYGKQYQASFTSNEDLKRMFFKPYEIVIRINHHHHNIDEIIKKVKPIIEEKYSLNHWKNVTGDCDEIIINHKKFDKWMALQHVAKYYNIPEENIIYFGDNINDLSSLKGAGYSYAMKNAVSEAKNSANEVLPWTNNEGGVGKKLLELLGAKDENN